MMGKPLSNSEAETIIKGLRFQLLRWSFLEVSDHSLLLRKLASERCRDSFRQLFAFYSPKLYGFALKGGLNEDQAKDLVQEVMTTIWAKAHLFNSEKGDAKTWIFTVARNARFDIYRLNAKDKNHLTSQEVWLTMEEADPKANLEVMLQEQQLKSQVEELPEDQKQVIKWLYFLGMTQEEVSVQHNIPLGTVKSRVRLALNKLSKVIKP